MPRTCTQCQTEKSDAQFKLKGRGRSKVCQTCEAVETQADVVATTPAPDADRTLLEIPPGLGARLRVSGPLLSLEQDRTDDDGSVYTHTVTLCPHEARKIVDAIAEFVEQEAA